MPIQPIFCLSLNGLLTTVDLLQKQSVLRWSHVRCSVAQWWLRMIVITEKTGSHLPTSGPAALIRDHLSMNISFVSPWFLQGCTNRNKSRAVLKKSDGAATAQRKKLRDPSFSMEELWSTCQVCHGHTWLGRYLGCDICHKWSCVIALAAAGLYQQLHTVGLIQRAIGSFSTLAASRPGAVVYPWQQTLTPVPPSSSSSSSSSSPSLSLDKICW